MDKSRGTEPTERAAVTDAGALARPQRTSPRAPRRLRGLVFALSLGVAAPASAACEPAEQAAAERQAREVAHNVSRRASEEGRRILRRAERELHKLRGKVRRGTARLRERGDEAKTLLQHLRPPPGTAPPQVADEAIVCEGNTCTIDQETAARFAGEPTLLLHEGAVIPAMSGTEITGLQIVSLRSGGVGERLGLRPGDTLTAIDDAPVAAALRDPAVQRQLAGKRSWTLALRRDGRVETRTIALR